MASKGCCKLFLVLALLGIESLRGQLVIVAAVGAIVGEVYHTVITLTYESTC
jgi:hypothetical protein